MVSRLKELALRLIKVKGRLTSITVMYICIMNRFMSRMLPFLLLVTILVITGFQVFWLKQNYDSEKKTLEVRTNINFREAVYNLQASQLGRKFGLPENSKDSFQVEIHEGGNAQDKLIRYNKTREMVSMVNIMREKEMDSLSDLPGENKSTITVIANHENPAYYFNDSSARQHGLQSKRNSDIRFIKLLNGIDSAGDSLKITDIKKSTLASFVKERINVPFNVARLDSADMDNIPRRMNEVTVGFNKPATYIIELGNTFPYLFKRLLSPLLFSLFLIGVTIASFVLLYRNFLQQKRLAVLKNDFISNVTHELKTPIATVNVALEAMKNFNAINDPVKTREYLEISQGELQRLSLLVDKVLRISMFENNETSLNTEPVDVYSLIREVASSMRLQFEKNMASVTIEKEGEDMMINADRLHMMSVIYNLFDNALKYSGDQAKINVKITDRGDRLDVIFTDNGMGIPEAYREKVFEKFFRVPHGDTHNVKGYGLGLSYVSRIIQQHHGSIHVDSEEGKGSRFFISIPRGDAGS
jgi:two-component system phosphate regulon sensor histidine kinase PhoR